MSDSEGDASDDGAFQQMSEDEEFVDASHEMITDAMHMTRVEIGGAETIDRYLSCPICLSVVEKPMATECLHRFCSDCIETSLRLGKKECPSCRATISTRRALRQDDNFERLVLCLYPEGGASDDEMVDLSKFRFTPLVPHTPPPQQKEAAQPGPSGGSAVPSSVGGTLASGGGARGEGAKWTCTHCTLLNIASARKCKACDAPNPTRGPPMKVRREKPSLTRLEGDGGADDVFEITEFRHKDGLVTTPAQPRAPRSAPPARSAALPRSVGALPAAIASRGSAGALSKRPRGQSDWDREMQRHNRAQLERPEEVKQAERQEREERHRGRQSEGVDMVSIDDLTRQKPAPLAPLDFSEASRSIEAQLLSRGTFSLDIKKVDAGAVHVIWCAIARWDGL